MALESSRTVVLSGVELAQGQLQAVDALLSPNK